jgi:proline iminopeptidase
MIAPRYLPVQPSVHPTVGRVRRFSRLIRMSYADFLAFRRSIPRPPRLERQTVRTRGVAFSVFTSPPVAGSPPICCVNGGMIYDHSMLWPALSPLAEHRQVVLFDLRGRGASAAPPNPSDATIHDDAADIGALRRALGIRQWDLLGHSWGGGIAMLAAANDLVGVRRLVLVDAVGPTSDWIVPLRVAVLERLQGAERAAVAAIDEETLTGSDPAVHSAYARAVYPAWFADRELASRFTPPEALSETGSAVLGRLRREGYDWRAILRALSTTTLVLHGEQDVLPPAVSLEDARILTNARHVVVPASGHMPFWEAPERFFALLESFLRAR